MIHLGAWPWTDASPEYDNLPSRDKGWLRDIGPVPVLGYAWAGGLGDYSQRTWHWLKEAGFRTATVRLWFDDASPDNPKTPPPPAEALERIREQADRPIVERIECVYQLDNEPNLERAKMGAKAWTDWALEFVRLWREVYPTRPITDAPLAQDAPNSDEWEEETKRLTAACDYHNRHYYWGRKPGDAEAGAKYSPEWAIATGRNLGKRIIVSECGNATNRADIAGVLTRWLGNPLIDRWHVYIMSSQGWPQWDYDEDEKNVLMELAKAWRARTFLPSEPVVPPVVSPADNLEHVRVIRNLALRQRQQIQELLFHVGKLDSDAQEIIDRCRAAGLTD